jgi:hypothetical protein
MTTDRPPRETRRIQLRAMNKTQLWVAYCFTNPRHGMMRDEFNRWTKNDIIASILGIEYPNKDGE